MTRNVVRLVAVLVLAVVVGACSSGGDTGTSAADREERVTVVPDRDAPEFVVNVYATDSGLKQETVFVPAGRYIKLVFRNHGTVEHHYRVIGLVPSQLRWVVFPILDEYDLDSMSDEELLSHGIDMSLPIGDIQHELHHLGITYSPMRPNSRSDIQPTGTEVHAITRRGKQDVVYFYALTTGTYEVVDAAFPEIRGKMVVFLPPDATIAEGS